MQITAYVRHQLAFNVHLDPENRAYRVMRKRPGEGGTEYWTADRPAAMDVESLSPGNIDLVRIDT